MCGSFLLIAGKKSVLNPAFPFCYACSFCGRMPSDMDCSRPSIIRPRFSAVCSVCRLALRKSCILRVTPIRQA